MRTLTGQIVDAWLNNLLDTTIVYFWNKSILLGTFLMQQRLNLGYLEWFWETYAGNTDPTSQSFYLTLPSNFTLLNRFLNCSCGSPQGQQAGSTLPARAVIPWQPLTAGSWGGTSPRPRVSACEQQQCPQRQKSPQPAENKVPPSQPGSTLGLHLPSVSTPCTVPGAWPQLAPELLWTLSERNHNSFPAKA